MFLPSESSQWTGNLKKLKIFKSEDTPGCNLSDTHDPGTVVDRGCDRALKDGSSQITDGISTYWGTSNDGDQVENGGLGSALLDEANRGSFYTNNNEDQIIDLDSISSDVFNTAGKSYDSTDLVNWLKGKKKDSEESRSWVLGDILHSRPVTLNYGMRTDDYSEDNPDIRIAFGTNYGQLHFIEDQGDHVVENWSFFAKESASIIPTLYEDIDDVPHPYGIDGQVSVIRLDSNRDGSIRKDDGDRMIIIFGMRRGGRSYYAIDVSDPTDKPELLWRIDNTTPGFEELAQSWSTPVPLILPGHRYIEEIDSTKSIVHYKYALAFGAGYDGKGINGNDDDRLGQTISVSGEDDRIERKLSKSGRGIFFVDAATGDLIKSFTYPDNINSNNDDPTRFEDFSLKWSVAAPPAVFDSNGDSLTDRVYFPDTGGNVFRIDIGKEYDEDDNEKAVWSLIKLAELGADETDHYPVPDSISDRRFLYQPEIVRTTHNGVRYDAVVLGSGNRANPLSETNSDRAYVIRDKEVFYKRFGTCNECVTPPEKITHSRLFDATDNIIQEGDTSESLDALLTLKHKYGWFIDLESPGEKATTNAQVYSGQMLFSTYSPSSEPGANICTPGIGSSRFYVVDLHTAVAIRDVDNDNKKQASDRWSLLSVIGTPGDAVIVSTEKGENLVELNSGYKGSPNEIGIHKYSWLEQ